MDIPKTLFATLVKQGRMEMHLTQESLAEKIGGNKTNNIKMGK